jgi:hypothetical protein
MTPFKAVYGQNPQSILSYLPYVSKVQEVDKNLIDKDNILHTLKDNIDMD